ncbi:hypothetical protein JQX13_24880 [Archangium violaceum]|uniref:hypothetical protein n=1 Tax=Archangium violaceum TaxID=83451 RepID=UPI00193BCCAA|nr:hypothetical protein [Archangium violaceum]QRK12982.1 hypothetical protein JQX13_24880 [Archangium violaceum]
MKKASRTPGTKAANAISTGQLLPNAAPGAIVPCNAKGTQRWKNKITKSGRPYRKPGPKTKKNEGQNKKIYEIIAREKKNGLIHIGGGNKTEKTIFTPGGKKPYRRADISFRDPKTGKIIHYNVGKVKKRGGAKIKREQDAFDDIQNLAPPTDRNIIFEAYP